MKRIPVLIGVTFLAMFLGAFFYLRWSNYEFSERTTAKRILHSSATGEFGIDLSDGRVLVFKMTEDYHKRFPGYVEKYRDLIEGATVQIDKNEFIFTGEQRSARESARLGIVFEIPNRMRDFDLSSDIHYSHGGEFGFGGAVDISPHVQAHDVIDRFDSLIETPTKVTIVCKRYFSFGNQGPPGP